MSIFARDTQDNTITQGPPRPQLPPLRMFVVEPAWGAEPERVAAHTVDFMPNGGVFFVEGIPLPDGRIVNRFVAAYQTYCKFYETAAPGTSPLSIS